MRHILITWSTMTLDVRGALDGVRPHEAAKLNMCTALQKGITSRLRLRLRVCLEPVLVECFFEFFARR